MVSIEQWIVAAAIFLARQYDPSCFVVVDDIRIASSGTLSVRK